LKTGRVLVIVVAAMLVGMTLYETAKNFLLPDLSLWQSHMITISFSGVIALLIGYVTLNKYGKLLARRDQAERELRLAHDALEARVTARTAELFESMKEAELANRAKSEMMANVSHELRTPLNAIIGFSSMMTEQMFGPLDGKYLEYSTDINHSGQHLLGLINDILDVAVIEAGKLQLRDEEVNLAEIVEATLQMVNVRGDEGGIRLTSANLANFPALHADKRRLKQILLNLLSNAIKFTPPGGEVSLTAALEDDGAVTIFVTDTGIGMDEEGVHQALSKFAQVDSGLDRKQDGNGLGLPLTVGLVELHGGQLHISSSRDHGTTVSVRFPPERTVLARKQA
jgi:signal transduction histidine kinase